MAAAGRFLTIDPYAGNANTPASLHRYLYGADDPVDNTDPSGMCVNWDEAGCLPDAGPSVPNQGCLHSASQSEVSGGVDSSGTVYQGRCTPTEARQRRYWVTEIASNPRIYAEVWRASGMGYMGGVESLSLHAQAARELQGVGRGATTGSTVAANTAGEMLTQGRVTEEELLSQLGEWSNPESLAKALNKRLGGSKWEGGYFAHADDAVRVAQRGPLGARVPYSGNGHMVLIEPIGGGKFKVRDPLPGITYEVDESWIRQYVNGGTWLR